MTVAVVGEALIDLLARPNGDYRPVVGGSPFNVAIALGRQEVPVHYLSPLSTDASGDRLARALANAKVTVPSHHRSERPSSLALVDLDDGGEPTYSLYREGVADRDVDLDRLMAVLPEGLELLHTGSLALVPEDVPMIRGLCSFLRAGETVVAVDVNMRENVVPDLAAYRAGIRGLFPLCDIVKLSDADLELLGMGSDLESAAAEILDAMSGGLVALTRGDRGAMLVNAEGALERPAARVERLVDTVGAGDCFQAGLLAGLRRHGLLSRRALASATPTELRPVLTNAAVSAAINVGGTGCQPPTRVEVDEAVRRDTWLHPPS